MPLESQEGRRWPTPLADRLPGNATAEQIAELVHALWQEIDLTLNPVIGHRGVAALCNRSLKLASRQYPWLAIGHPGVLVAMDPAVLKAAFAQQAPDTALAGANVLFQSLHELLGSLVGSSLTDRLLRSVCVHSSGAPPLPLQDTST